MSMLERFKAFIEKHKLIPDKNIPVLLGVSGGMDSVLLAELFHMAGLPFAVAHCNFGLRGQESDEDEAFVSQLAASFAVKFFHVRFDTLGYAGEHGISVQMAARDLRRLWFRKLIKSEGYAAIALAHHADDDIETFFINMYRVSGISGLRGILPENNGIIRPLLFARRSEIEAFITKNQLPYREDSSNRSDKYLRNKIRHQLLPALDRIEPGFRESIVRSLQNLKETDVIFQDRIEYVRQKLILELEDKSVIVKSSLRKYQPLNTWLYEVLRPFGFSIAVVNDMVEALNGTPGKIFLSQSHELLIDRDQLIIRERMVRDARKEYFINSTKEILVDPIQLKFRETEASELLRIPAERSVAALDAEKLSFPLLLRKWRQGDFFFPLGMNGSKKLSDFFIDAKFSKFDKEECWIICSGEDIVWVVGHRIDDRYKITDETTKVLLVQLT